MTIKLFLLFSLTCFLSSFAQEIDTTDFSKYYYRKKSTFEVIPNKKNEIIFLGNSITDQCNWSELFENKHIINRGISGDRTDGILFRLKEITESKPNKVFILIGTNDIHYGRSVAYILEKSKQIIQKIKIVSPKTNIYLQSILPTYGHRGRPTKTVKEINLGFQNIALEEKITYVNLFPHFLDNNTGRLNKIYSIDGLHLNGEGYLLWKDLIKDFVSK